MISKDQKIKCWVEAEIPTSWGQFTMRAYSISEEEKMPHLALMHNYDSKKMETVNVRIHSECETGDIFHSLRCDCGDQLAFSMDYLQKHGGVLIYLRQEGRGIGLISKLKAYNEQDNGLNTIEANETLGYPADGRNYQDAVTILQDLGIHKVNLITNNPDKVSGLETEGISVISRIPVIIKPNTENKRYLRTKKEKMGHFLD